MVVIQVVQLIPIILCVGTYACMGGRSWLQHTATGFSSTFNPSTLMAIMFLIM